MNLSDDENQETFLAIIFYLSFVTFFSYIATIYLSPFVCILFVPFLLVSIRAPYQNINSQLNVQPIIDSIKEKPEEPAGYLTKFLSLLWPHIFSQKRADQFKEMLQPTLDNISTGVISRIHLLELQLGQEAPQFVCVTLPQNFKQPTNALIICASMLYYPSIVMKADVYFSKGMSTNVSFNDLTIQLDCLIKFEFKSDPSLVQIPFWTGLELSIIKAPTVAGFNFSGTISPLINRDSFKHLMSSSVQNNLLNSVGVPNGLCWERINGSWFMKKIHFNEKLDNNENSSKIKKCSLSTSEIIRISFLKNQTILLCQQYNIPIPLFIITTKHADIKTSTKTLVMLGKYEEINDPQKYEQFYEECMNENFSDDESFLVFTSCSKFLKKCMDNVNTMAEQMPDQASFEKAQMQIMMYISYVNQLQEFYRAHPKISSKSVKTNDVQETLDRLSVFFVEKLEKLAQSALATSKNKKSPQRK